MQQYTMNWNYPTAVRVGAGRIAELADACRELGMSAPDGGGVFGDQG